MSIQVNKDGVWQEISQQEFLELVKNRVIRPETVVTFNGQKVVAATISGVTFPSDAAIPPPLPETDTSSQAKSFAEKIPWEAMKRNGMRFLRWVLPILKKGGEKAVEAAKKGGELAVEATKKGAEHAVEATKKAAPHVKAQLDKIPVEAMKEQALQQVDKVPGGRKRLVVIAGAVLLVLVGGWWMKGTRDQKNVSNAEIQSDNLSVEQKNSQGVETSAESYFQEGLNGWKARNLEVAYEGFKKAAELGHAKAQYSFANLHLGTFGFEKAGGEDKAGAEKVKWYLKAAEQNHIGSQVELGHCYQRGDGVKKSDIEAVKWYRQAAEQGSSDGQNCLGLRYLNGEGVKKDAKEALKWFRKSAAQGNGIAQYNIAICYANGNGVTKDIDEAIVWCRKAADQGNERAKEDLDYLLSRKEVKSTSGGESSAQKEVDAFSRKFGTDIKAKDMDGNTLLHLAAMYENVRVIEYLVKKGASVNAQNGIKWTPLHLAANSNKNIDVVPFLLSQGADAEALSLSGITPLHAALQSNNDEAAEILANHLFKTMDLSSTEQLYQSGLKTYNSEKHDVAFFLFGIAGSRGNIDSQFMLGLCYELGHGTPKNMYNAAVRYRKAAERGHVKAQCHLGACYAAGEGVRQNHSEAENWWRKAAKQGDASAQFMIGMACFKTGKKNEGLEWITKAAEQGHDGALKSINQLDWR